MAEYYALEFIKEIPRTAPQIASGLYTFFFRMDTDDYVLIYYSMFCPNFHDLNQLGTKYVLEEKVEATYNGPMPRAKLYLLDSELKLKPFDFQITRFIIVKEEDCMEYLLT